MVSAKSRALLLLDVTAATVQAEGSFAANMQGVNFVLLRERLATAVAAARAAGETLVWVVPGEAFISRYRPVEPGDDVPDSTVGTPTAGEPIVHKAEIGAFENSSLDELLRGKGISHVVLAGVATQYVVAVTAREAVALGYDVTVLEDASADLTPDAHAQTIAALGDIATVTTVDEEWAAGRPV